MKRLILLMLLAFFAAAFIGFVFRDAITTGIFERESFVACFRNELVVAAQSEGLRTNNDLLVFSADSILGSQLESYGNQIVDGIERHGLTAVYDEAAAKQSKLLLERASAAQTDGSYVESAVPERVAGATKLCIERVRFY